MLLFVGEFSPSLARALDAPALTGPSDGLTVNTVDLNWQTPAYALYSTNHYRIQVDNNADFSSPEKDYYPSDNSYSPQNLSEGIYYWHVKAKDETSNWSDWSAASSFILSLADSTTPQATVTPAPAPIPTSTPTPTVTPTITSAPTKAPATFTFSQPPAQINSDQFFTITLNLTGLSPAANYFLKGAFSKGGSTNYFGQTQVGSTWVKNNQSCTSQFLITTDSSGSWTGNLEIMPDSGDSGLTGSGDYLFKIGRYSASCSNLTWSSTATVYINDNRPTAIPIPTPTPTPEPTFPPVSTPGVSLQALETTGSTSLSSLQLPLDLVATSSSVAGVAIYSEPKIGNEPIQPAAGSPPSLLIILGVLVLLFSSVLIVLEQNPTLSKRIKSFKIAPWWLQLPLPRRLKNWAEKWPAKLPEAPSWLSPVRWVRAKLPLFRDLPGD